MSKHLGINEQRARELIASSDVDKLREYAGAFLDELIEARQLIHDKLSAPTVPTNPVILWAAAVESLRRLAARPGVLGLIDIHQLQPSLIRRCADWLAAIGPDTDNMPCEVCLRPTSRSCSRCDRSLCTSHATLNTATSVHPGGLHCV